MCDALTEAEQACCHMSMWSLSAGDLAQWREEFAKLPRSEVCADCPLLGQVSQRVAKLRQLI